MIKLLGKKVVTFIVLLLALDVGIYFGYDSYLLPIHLEQQQKLNSTKAAVESRRAEVQKMKEEFVLLQSQLRNFKEIEYDGFFSNQNRSAATEMFDDLSKKAGLLKANIIMKKGDLLMDQQADDAHQTVLKTEVSVPVDSLDDVDVYTFLSFLEREFPGVIDFTSIKLDRNEILNAAMLRKIGGGAPTPLVRTNIVFDWYTMIPKDAATTTGKIN